MYLCENNAKIQKSSDYATLSKNLLLCIEALLHRNTNCWSRWHHSFDVHARICLVCKQFKYLHKVRRFKAVGDSNQPIRSIITLVKFKTWLLTGCSGMHGCRFRGHSWNGCHIVRSPRMSSQHGCDSELSLTLSTPRPLHLPIPPNLAPWPPNLAPWPPNYICSRVITSGLDNR